ncbi:MAG: hypothetical protein KIT48_21510 [Pseudolabrys sp.]|nr:hypothetical protein [Pseudolabrys sp.]
MLSSFWRRVLFGSLSFFLIVFIVSWESGSTGEVCSVNEKTHHQECTKYNLAVVPLAYALAALRENGEAIIALFTVILGISTIGLWNATNRLWEAGERQMRLTRGMALNQQAQTRESNRIAADTAERQLRAYLHVSPTNFRFNRADNGLMICKGTYDIKNLGQTPAYAVRTDVGFAMGEFPLSDDLPILEPNAVVFQQAIGPGQTLEGTGESRVQEIKLRSGGRLYFYGVVRYRDAFDAERETYFCGSLSPFDSVFGAPNGIKTVQTAFKWSERHNSAT